MGPQSFGTPLQILKWSFNFQLLEPVSTTFIYQPCTRILVRICIPSSSWAWWVGVVTRTMTSLIEYLETFAGENFLNWLKQSISRIKTFVDCRPHAFPVTKNFFGSPPTRFLVPRTKIRRRRQYSGGSSNLREGGSFTSRMRDKRGKLKMTTTMFVNPALAIRSSTLRKIVSLHAR